MLRVERTTLINNFSLGLITKIRELNGMSRKGTPDCMDVYSDLDGSLSERRGRVKLNVAQVGAGTKDCHGLFDFEGTLIGSFGTTYYKMDELDGTWDSLQTGMKDEPIECEDYEGNLFICNWGQDYIKTMQAGDTSVTNLNTSNVGGRGKHPKVYKDHFIVSGVPGYDYTFYYTENGDIDDFANGGTWPVATHDGDELTGWGELEGRLYAFKRWSIHQMSYRGGSPYWARTQITRGIGTRSPKTIKNVTLKTGEEVLLFLGSDRKLYKFDGYNCDAASEAFEENNEICPISMSTLNQGGLKYAHAVVDTVNHLYIIFVANGGTSTITHAIAYNYYTGAAWPFKNQALKSSVDALDANGRKWIIVGDYHGFSYFWNYGTIDEVGFANMETGADGSLDAGVDEYVRSAGPFLSSKTHDGGDDKAYAQDSSENFTTLGALVGDMVINKTDKCYAEISAIGNGGGTNDKLTLATLAGGTGNDFDDDDTFEIYKGIFISDNHSIYIGSPEPFNAIVIDLIQNGSSSITPTVYYSSDDAGGYTELSVADGTSGFTKSGTITFTEPSGWETTAKDDGGNAFTDTTAYYYIKIKRTADTLTTKPKVSKINIGNVIEGYHTTPRLMIQPGTLQQNFQVKLSMKAISDDAVNFYERRDYKDDWSAAKEMPLYNPSGEYYLGTTRNGLNLGTGTLGPDKPVIEKVFGLDSQGTYIQFKINGSSVTEPWTLYAYELIGTKIALTNQEKMI